MQTFEIASPSTVTVRFKNDLLPATFTLHDSAGALFFFRDIPKGRLEIKVNINKPGTFKFNTGLIDNIEPIKIRPLNIVLPPYERNREKPYKVFFNPGLTQTPARHHTATGRIEVGPLFKKQIKPIQRFILLHEQGHFFYQDEHKADLYAAKKFIEEGFNNSTAMYALTKVLKNTPANTIRKFKLDKNLNKR